MNENILSLRQVAKSYKSGNDVIRILRDINLEVKYGESIAIMGASGCGKSTLLNLVGGLDSADSGHIESCGFTVDQLKEKQLTTYRASVVSFVFQFHYLLKDFTAIENVMLPLVMAKNSRKVAREMAKECLQKVGMDDRGHHFPSQLSGGERQRTALARALVNDPKLILADEPTGNLDEKHKNNVTELMFSLLYESKKSLLIVTHASDIADCADKKYLLKDGFLEQQ